MSTTLTTARLVLRPFKLDDADDLTRWVGDRRVAEMTSLIPHPYEPAMAVEWLERVVGYDDDSGHRIFAITLAEDGRLIGCIGLHSLEKLPIAEFGYWIAVPFWGRGYATEALRAVLRHGFGKMMLRRIEAHHFAHNPASGRVMEKAGMRREGMQRLRAHRMGELLDRVCYGLIDEEWKELR